MRKLGIAVAAAAAIFAGAAFAHHSTNLGFYPDKRVTLQAEFVAFKWINPHTLMEFTVVNAKGEKEKWIGETHSTPTLARAGWRKNMFKPGDKITVFGQPGRKDPHVMHILTITTAGGKVYNANASNT